jgi:hypothetical protein
MFELDDLTFVQTFWLVFIIVLIVLFLTNWTALHGGW